MPDTLSRIVKACGCGSTYTRDAWEALPLIARWKIDADVLELRACPCGSSIGLPVLASAGATKLE